MGDTTKALGAAIAGALLAWTAHSFTIDGELRAFEHSLTRIEARLDAIQEQQTANLRQPSP